jgi:hypothetical protein
MQLAQKSKFQESKYCSFPSINQSKVHSKYTLVSQNNNNIKNSIKFG